MEMLLAEGGSDLSIDRIVRIFPFPLDAFQKKAVEKILEGRSVVVCAPTGAGKTAIAEAASVAMLAKGKRVIYTTPLKARAEGVCMALLGAFSIGTHRWWSYMGCCLQGFSVRMSMLVRMIMA